MKRDNLSLVGVSVTQDAKSPFWVAQWSLSNGARVKRSTKVPVEGGLFQGERLSKVQARKRALLVAQELAAAAQVEAERVDNLSVRELFDTVLKGKLGRLSVATYANARTTYAQFCEWLGARRAQEPARLVTRADIKQWVTDRRAEVRCKTVQHGLYVLRAAFNWALDAELIARNPCDRVSVPPDSKDERVVHEAFSQEEVQVLVEKLPDEWAAAVRCCLGTFGQRLGDIRQLRWDQFDWELRVVNMTTGKTGRRLQQPMLAGFYEWARARYEWAQGQGGDAAVWVLPRLRVHSNPSQEFTQLVRLHGIGLQSGGGQGKRRTWHSKTFHCLRSTVVTMLHANGVSQGMAMELVGHDSSEVHAVYLRPTAEQLRVAAGRLPIDY
ncbi:MAG: tyrosine-type recombinase/integrase [Akkermansia sp.]|nr:tyrosine-type recombinase/integrase [Akkermansia sp.]